MSLLVYKDTPFFSGNQVDEVDVYTGNGVTTTFVLSRKTVSRLAATVQFDATQYYSYNSGFVKTLTGFTTNTAPPLNSQGIAPGLTNLLFDQLFDQDNIPGTTSPRVQEIPLYIADSSDIPLYKYTQIPSLPGIELSIVDFVSSAGALTSFIQLACAQSDATGAALTYQATGTALYTGVLTAFGGLLASSAASASSILVDLASSFTLGDYVYLNAGQPTQEIVKFIGYSPPYTMLLTGATYPHSKGETVYACGRKFWMKCTVPLNETGGQAANFIDLSLRTRFVKRSRL